MGEWLRIWEGNQSGNWGPTCVRWFVIGETSQQCWETWIGCGCWLEETLGAESRIMFEEIMTGGWHQDVRGFGQQRQHEGALQVWRFEVQDNLMLVVT